MESVTIVRSAPRSRTFYVEVRHHGWVAAVFIKGRDAAEARAARMLDHARSQCSTIGPVDARPSEADLLAEGDLCPGQATEAGER